jgi:hypothetical protein
LNSFIVSKPPFTEIEGFWRVSGAEMTARHVDFRKVEGYIADLLRLARRSAD